MQGLPSDLLQRTIRRCEEEGRTPVVRVIEAPSDCKEIRAAAASNHGWGGCVVVRGDAVVVTAYDGREIARGITAYSANDGRRIMGNKTGPKSAIFFETSEKLFSTPIASDRSVLSFPVRLLSSQQTQPGRRLSAQYLILPFPRAVLRV